MAAFQKNPDNIGAFWWAKDDDGKLRKDANGNPFMTGNIEVGSDKVPVVLFKNGFKKEDKQPDFKLMKKTAQAGAGTKTKDETPF